MKVLLIASDESSHYRFWALGNALEKCGHTVHVARNFAEDETAILRDSSGVNCIMVGISGSSTECEIGLAVLRAIVHKCRTAAVSVCIDTSGYKAIFETGSYPNPSRIRFAWFEGDWADFPHDRTLYATGGCKQLIPQAALSSARLQILASTLIEVSQKKVLAF